MLINCTENIRISTNNPPTLVGRAVNLSEDEKEMLGRVQEKDTKKQQQPAAREARFRKTKRMLAGGENAAEGIVEELLQIEQDKKVIRKGHRRQK